MKFAHFFNIIEEKSKYFQEFGSIFTLSEGHPFSGGFIRLSILVDWDDNHDDDVIVIMICN